MFMVATQPSQKLIDCEHINTDLQTFQLPKSVSGTQGDIDIARKMIQAWRTEFKSQCISDLTYSGYIASGEEVTAGETDYSEIFTICQVYKVMRAYKRKFRA